MDIYINTVKMDFTLENEKNIGDILKAIENDCEKNNATITRVSIDGEYIPDDKIDEVFKCDIKSIKKLEIETVEENDVLLALRDLSIKINHINTELLQIPLLLQSSKDAKVASIITLFVDNFDIMCHLLALCSLFPKRFDSFTIDGKSLSLFLQEFTPILHEFENSLSTHDTILTGDLAEYEIVPRLQSFNIAVENL